MLPSAGDVIPLSLVLIIPAGMVFLAMPRYIRFLYRRNKTTKDAHNSPTSRVRNSGLK